MDLIKLYFNKYKRNIRNWYIDQWNEGIYGKGVVIFASFTALMLFIKIIYSIFA